MAAPRGEAAVLCGCNAQVVVELEVNIPEGAGKRAHVREHGECQSVRMPRGRVRVLPQDGDAHSLRERHRTTSMSRPDGAHLPQDYDAHRIEVAGSEGGELVLTRRQHRAGGPLVLDEAPQLRKVRLPQLIRQRGAPALTKLPPVLGGVGGGGAAQRS